MIKYVLALVALLLPLTASADDAENTARLVVAGGCFWCVESDFDRVPGVISTVSGYTGGSLENPTYRQVSGGGTGHLEAVEITYDPSKVALDDLLVAFWHSVDPTDPDGQFCDRGHSYKTAVFVSNPEERAVAEMSRDAAEAELGQTIVTQISDAAPFYPAETYHQDYYMKNSVRYKYYRWACGRNQKVESLWGDSAYEGIPEHS